MNLAEIFTEDVSTARYLTVKISARNIKSVAFSYGIIMQNGDVGISPSLQMLLSSGLFYSVAMTWDYSRLVPSALIDSQLVPHKIRTPLIDSQFVPQSMATNW